MGQFGNVQKWKEVLKLYIGSVINFSCSSYPQKYFLSYKLLLLHTCSHFISDKCGLEISLKTMLPQPVFNMQGLIQDNGLENMKIGNGDQSKRQSKVISFPDGAEIIS